jgi:aspartyl aminopeptidase
MPAVPDLAAAGHRQVARDLLDYLDLSPSPWHAVSEAARRLEEAGFARLDESQSWRLEPGGAYYLMRGGSALAAFVAGSAAPAEAGFRLAAAHTDSPGLRVKPQGEHAKGGLLRLGVEIYGGPILATWTDRELGLAGRVLVADPGSRQGVAGRTVWLRQPLLRLPNAAIHLNREVNNKGLLLDKQEELPLLLAAAAADLPAGGLLRRLLGEAAGVDAAEILAFDLCACETQPAAFWGPEEEFVASGRLDNLAMCHAALLAILEARGAARPWTRAAVLFDHEEVGSQSAQGADGSFLPDLLERAHEALGGGRQDGDRRPGGREAFLRACSRSFLVSADMAHALHPSYQRLYEPQHHVALNGGPVIKLNSNLRYTTDGASAARFQRVCAAAEVPLQRYVHRTDLPCGTTIGPMASSRLGIAAVDVGNPMLSMHSIRECAGALDPLWMARALAAFLQVD